MSSDKICRNCRYWKPFDNNNNSVGVCCFEVKMPVRYNGYCSQWKGRKETEVEG